MSVKEVIELEWFDVNDKLPDANRTIFMKIKYPTLSTVTKVGYYSNRGSDFADTEGYYISKQRREVNDSTTEYGVVTEWCYYPFDDLDLMYR